MIVYKCDWCKSEIDLSNMWSEQILDFLGLPGDDPVCGVEFLHFCDDHCKFEFWMAVDSEVRGKGRRNCEPNSEKHSNTNKGETR